MVKMRSVEASMMLSLMGSVRLGLISALLMLAFVWGWLLIQAFYC